MSIDPVASMTGDGIDVRHETATSQPSRRRRRRRWPWVVVAVVVLAGCWLAFRAAQIATNLQSARTALTAAQAELLDGKSLPPGLVQQAAGHTRTARDAARDPVWSIAAHIPVLGRPFRTVAGIAEIGDRVTHESLPRLDQVSQSLQQIRDADAPHSLPLPAMRTAAGGLGQVDAELSNDLYALQHLPSTGIGPIAHAQSLLLDQLGKASDQVHTAAVGTALGVPMLGGDGERHYFVAFENPAEARPDMGLLAGFAEVRADAGRLHKVFVGSSSDLPRAIAPTAGTAPVLTQGYEGFGMEHTWSESNLSPDFAEDAGVWTAMYSTSTHRPMDGAIALDPVAMGTILAESGRNLTIPNIGTIKAADLPQFLESTEYTLPIPESTRKQLLAKAARQTLDALLASHTPTIQLARALGHLAGTGHLHLFSSHAVEQTQLAGLPIAGVLPTTTRPFAGSYVTNAAANKLDYYLDEKLAWTTNSCESDGVHATVTVTLTNDVPNKGVPSFVTKSHAPPSVAVPNRTHRVLLSLVLAPGSAITDASIGGQPASWALVSTERGSHPLRMLTVVLPPHAPQVVRIQVTEPGAHGTPLLDTQPLPTPPATGASGTEC